MFFIYDRALKERKFFHRALPCAIVCRPAGAASGFKQMIGIGKEYNFLDNLQALQLALSEQTHDY